MQASPLTNLQITIEKSIHYPFQSIHFLLVV